MYYLLEYKKFKNKTILYLHGLDGELNDKYKDILNELGFGYVGLSTNYKKDNVWDIISKMEIDGVIGHSLGGYMAYYLSNYKNIPALLLMPSFDKEDIKLQEIPNEVKKLPLYKKKIALIGAKDTNVDAKLQEKGLKNIEVHEEKIDHDMTNIIFKKYCKIFLEKFY